MTLDEFLLARIAEDEAVARRAPFWEDVSSRLTPAGDFNQAFAERITPAWVLAECEARRRAIEEAWNHHESIEGEYGTGKSREQMGVIDDNPPAVQWLATPYVDHPDYRQEWRP